MINWAKRKHRRGAPGGGVDMLKIFVTGDNHIGLKYASHEKGGELAARRIAAFDGMVADANREGCALFVITGDLFENTYGIAKATVKTLLDKLSAFHGTVAVLPGNHDYYDADVKLWQYFKDLMREHDNIMLLSEFRPYELELNGERAVLYPALCTAHHSAPGENNLGWIKAAQIPPDGTYHIGIAHGAVEGETIDSEGRYFIMTRRELESIGVDVWLIGHTHVPFPRNLTQTPGEHGRIFNPGTHVQTDVNCNTEGQCFVIELDADKNVRAKKLTSGNLRFYRREVKISGEGLETALTRALADIGDESAVDVIITGAVSAEEHENRAAIIDAALARFVEGTYNDYALSKIISKKMIESEFAETSFSAGLLNALMDEPKEAQLAYELLKALKEEK